MPRPFSDPLHEPALAREQRRARGVFYTPVEIAEWIVAQTYGPALAEWNGHAPPPRLLDPACGAGVFLLAARRALEARCHELQIDPVAAVEHGIHGIDIDPASVLIAREHTQLSSANITCANSLTVAAANEFAVVVGNPPYVSIRELAKSHTPEQVAELRQRFRTARGNFDLYVLFIERALQWLQPGGRLGFIVPNKWATLDYARALRELLLAETSVEQVVDLSALRVFPQAGTYPQIIVLQRKAAANNQRFWIAQGIDTTSIRREVQQADLQPGAFVFGEEIDVENRVATVPFDAVAKLHSGASGYSATKLSDALQEARATPCEAADFIVSGNIDRYKIQVGNVRFLNRSWQRPVLTFDSPQLNALKRKLYREPKVVLSGMCQRLEAAYDEQGCALGVQVYAAAEMKCDPFYLLGALNSKLLSYLFRERFAAKRLASGYLAINKGQLAQLPIAMAGDRNEKLQRTISDLAQQLHQRHSAALDQQLDELIYQLYEITPAERERIEASFAEKPVRTRAA
ncbi:Eco57I restriction-modification methylase domain-containing protein [Anatilimnocola floriformis]|uniref:Eco57I restriction-modification methylase domain-containing protein n=1 Tax=Anatilimnocola floriformis TaxID=2948575 RepID=UPI0020C2592B|nr:N-6 DNA methylase [Anatilimnocola floriformis]